MREPSADAPRIFKRLRASLSSGNAGKLLFRNVGSPPHPLKPGTWHLSNQKSKIRAFREVRASPSRTLEGTPAEARPGLTEKWLLLHAEDSGRLIGGGVTLTVQIVTRVIHHVISQAREAAGTSARPGREPRGRTLNPCEPPLRPRPEPLPSCQRCLQNDSTSVRAHDPPS